LRGAQGLPDSREGSVPRPQPASSVGDDAVRYTKIERTGAKDFGDVRMRTSKTESSGRRRSRLSKPNLTERRTARLGSGLLTAGAVDARRVRREQAELREDARGLSKSGDVSGEDARTQSPRDRRRKQ